MVLLFFVFVAFLMFEIVLFSPETLEEKKNIINDKVQQTSELEGAEQIIRKFHLVESTKEVREWELWADKALNYEGKTIWNLSRVKIRFYSEDKPSFVVTGDIGTIHLKTKNIRIEGSVLIQSSNGYELSTSLVVYDSEKKQLESPVKVNMRGIYWEKQTTFKLDGFGMIVDIKKNLIFINSQVRAWKQFQDDQDLKISSQRAEFSGDSFYSKFINDVLIDRETIRVTGKSAHLKYYSDSFKLKSMLVTDNVKVSDIDKWAISDTVFVEFEENKYTFRGNPRVVQDNDELIGDEIIFLDGGKRVKVHKARAKVDRSRMENVN